MKNLEEKQNWKILNDAKKKTLVIARKSFLWWFIIDLILFTYYWGLHQTISKTVIFLTNWGYTLTLFFLVVTNFALFNKKKLFKSHFFHICLAIEFLITIFYWGILYKNAVFDDHYQHFFAITRHLLPLAYLIIEFRFNNIILNKSSFRVLIFIMLLYSFHNYILNVFLEIEVYSVITWKDFKSIIYIVLAICISIVGWGIFFFLQKFKFIL